MNKSNFKLFIFTPLKILFLFLRASVFLTGFIFSLCLFLPSLNAGQEPSFFEPEPEKTISMDFQDARLKDILKIFSIQSGLNFIASEGVQDRTMTLYLDNVPLKEAMNKLFKANNLSYELDRASNIFIVKDWGKPQIETVTKIFYLKHATVSSSSLKEEMSAQIKSTSGAAGGGAAGGGAAGGGGGKWAIEEDTGITKVVKKLLSDNGSVIEDYRTNSLIVKDIPSRIPIIAQAIAFLDVPVPQVLIEIEMLDVSKGLVDKIGVDWPETIASLDVTGARVTSFPFWGSKRFKNQGETLAPETTAGGWENVTWPGNSFGPSILTIIGDELKLDFLRTQTDTKTLARPKILTLNNETAEIKITAQEVVGEKKTTGEEGGEKSVTYEAERYETGVSLRVTPQINVETGEITMFIVPTVTDATRSSVASAFGATYYNPEVRSTKAVVKVRDGETIIIGGLIRNDFSNTEEKLPILGDIPVLGALFRHKYKDKDRQRELLVFITPHIIKDTDIGFKQAKKAALPEREQNTVSGIDRQATINASLNSFEKKKR